MSRDDNANKEREEYTRALAQLNITLKQRTLQYRNELKEIRIAIKQAAHKNWQATPLLTALLQQTNAFANAPTRRNLRQLNQVASHLSPTKSNRGLHTVFGLVMAAGGALLSWATTDSLYTQTVSNQDEMLFGLGGPLLLLGIGVFALNPAGDRLVKSIQQLSNTARPRSAQQRLVGNPDLSQSLIEGPDPDIENQQPTDLLALHADDDDLFLRGVRDGTITLPGNDEEKRELLLARGRQYGEETKYDDLIADLDLGSPQQTTSPRNQ